MDNYEMRIEGFKALKNLSEADRKNPKKLLEIEDKYNLGYAHICEFCDKSLRKIILILYHYAKLNVRTILTLLNVNKEKISKYDMTPNQVLEGFLDLKKEDADKLIAFVDHSDKLYREKFAKKFASGIRIAMNKTFGAHAIKTLSIDEAELFKDAFENEWNYLEKKDKEDALTNN